MWLESRDGTYVAEADIGVVGVLAVGWMGLAADRILRAEDGGALI
jgi:hypothetical protein